MLFHYNYEQILSQFFEDEKKVEEPGTVNLPDSPVAGLTAENANFERLISEELQLMRA